MVEIKFCPSTLAEGYNTYSPQAVKRLFDGKRVSPFLDFNINELKQSDVIVRAMQRISVSGVQEKFSGLIDQNSILKYSGCYEDIAKCIRKTIPAWIVDMERFFELVVFNYIYANGDDHLKNFSVIRQGSDYRLAPAYDLLNTSLHVIGDDFGLDGGLSPDIEKSDVYDRTGHPCRLDFERFGAQIGLADSRIKRVLNKYMVIPELTMKLVGNSYLNDKMKRKYLRIVDERVKRFVRKSE